VPQVGEDLHAARLDLGGLRVLVLVDHVLLDGLGHQQVRLPGHPRRHERREVQAGAAVEQQLAVDHLVGGLEAEAVLRELAQRRIFERGHRGACYAAREARVADPLATRAWRTRSRGARGGPRV
jgi:hypothetical protein